MIEEWKIIKNYPDYLISSLGRVKSLKRYGKISERILTCVEKPKGYFVVNLHKGIIIKNFFIHRLVLMAFKPINNPQDFQCNHIDGNKQNNCIDNLEWCTQSENQLHAYKIGLQKWTIEAKTKLSKFRIGKNLSEEAKKKISISNKGKHLGKNHYMYGKHHSENTKRKMSEKQKGKNNPNCKLTEEQVIKIKKLLKEGVLSQRKLAKMFNVSYGTIYHIKKGTHWKNMKV
jgi:DNA-binding XRE family transcriptional regulator